MQLLVIFTWFAINVFLISAKQVTFKFFVFVLSLIFNNEVILISSINKLFDEIVIVSTDKLFLIFALEDTLNVLTVKLFFIFPLLVIYKLLGW